MKMIWRIASAIMLAAAALAYLGLGYVAAAWQQPPLIALIVGLVPLALLGLSSAFQLTRGLRVLAIAIWIAALIVVFLQLEHLRTHTAHFYFIQHAGAMGFLAFTFGTTLGGTHEQALCSRMARMMLMDAMDARYAWYTWWVTAAWTGFFAACGAASVLLFFWGSLEAWSLLANVMTPIFVVGLFGVEYLVRLRVLPDRAHLSVLQTIRAYQRYRRASP